MSRARIVLVVGAVAAAAASAVVGSVFGLRVLLSRQAAVARRRIGKPLGESAPRSDRVWRWQVPRGADERLSWGGWTGRGPGGGGRGGAPGAAPV